MRVLIINTNVFCRDGISNVIQNLYRAMDKQGLHIDLMAINKPGEAVEQLFQEHGGRVFVIHRSMRNPLRYLFALRKCILQGGYDLVHIHGNSATMALEMVAAWLAGCKVRIAHSHNTTCKFMTAHRLLKPIFGALCTHRLACGIDAGNWLYGKRKFTVVNNGIDTARYGFTEEGRRQLRQQYGIEDDQIVLGHVGVFNEAKNQRFLLEILAELDERYKLLLVGDGKLRPAVESRAADLGVAERVIFAGLTDRVPDYLSAFDCIVMPSLHEGLPLALVEQQTNGLQCVVSDTITRETDKTGNLSFLPLDAGAKFWAEEIVKLQLPEDRIAASKAATEKIKNCGYDIHDEAAKLKEFYIAAIKKVGTYK